MPDKHNIGLERETSLHAALKQWCSQPGDCFEVRLDSGHVADILCADNLSIIEIQTRSFSSLKRKLAKLVEERPVLLVHPVAQTRTIVRISVDGEIVSQRKSPRKGRAEQVFKELVSFPALTLHPNFVLDVLLIHEEQIWRDDGEGSWRRKGWSIADRRLVEVVERVTLATAADFARFLPSTLPETFTVKDLATASKLLRPLAGKMAFCLREMDIINVVGKQGKAWVYSRCIS
ncbi:MAG: hypothetical protein H7175_21455 [Burkholderiales bacterium]|nr:hypothetical protein [Anaerolineae bacterium]